MATKRDYHIRTTCRLCDHAALERVLELPDTPLANEFMPVEALASLQDKFPLFLSRCAHCAHVQLPVVVNPERLFRNYVYVSGTSKTFIDHLQSHAKSVIAKHQISVGNLIVEIGSNDGTALRAFKREGMRVMGIDPAISIANDATRSGIPTIPMFFTHDLAHEIHSRHGHARVVVANNVFAHADDLAEIVDGVVTMLHPENGIFVFEVQHLAAMMENNYFDMIYHEHLSYHALGPLLPFLAAKGLNILECQPISTHGGSIRITAGFQQPTAQEQSNLHLAIEKEEHQLQRYSFAEMKLKIDLASRDILELLATNQNKVWGFGAPAKLTTLFYGLKLEQQFFVAIIDDNPLKQGLHTPGEHLPIVGFHEFARKSRAHEVILVFAWNFASQIKQRFEATPHVLYTPLPRLQRLN